MQFMLITVAESPASRFQPDLPVSSSQAASRRTHPPHPAFQPHWPSVCFNMFLSVSCLRKIALAFASPHPHPAPYPPSPLSFIPQPEYHFFRQSPPRALTEGDSLPHQSFYHSPFISLKKNPTICSFIHWPFLLNKHKTPWREIIFVAFKVIYLYQWVENVLVQCVHNNSLLNK